MPFAPMSKIQQEQMQEQGQGPINISGGQGAKFDVVPGQEKKQGSSGQYANLQNYLKANQPQAAQMGQKVTQSVEQKGQEAQQKLGQFEQQKPNVAAYDPSQAIANAPTLSQQDKQQFQQMRQTGGYTGPQQLEQAAGYKETRQAAQKASDAAKMAATEAGQQELLKQTFARPKYSEGETKLDQVLLMGNQQAKQGLSDLSQKYSDLYNVFNQKAQDVGAGINQAQQQALANRQAIEAQIPQAWQNLLNPIQQRAEQANIENPALINRVLEDVNDTALKQETLQRLGLAPNTRLFNLNLASYLQPNFQAVGVNEVANAEERAKYQALADLFQDPTRQEIGAQGQTFNPLGFNKQQFEQDAFNRLSEFNANARGQRVNTNYRAWNPDRSGFVDVAGDMSILDLLEANPNTDFARQGLTAFDLAYPNLNVVRSYNQENQDPTVIASKMLLPGQEAPAEFNQVEAEAMMNAKNDLYTKLMDYLNRQNYNRVITEET